MYLTLCMSIIEHYLMKYEMPKMSKRDFKLDLKPYFLHRFVSEAFEGHLRGLPRGAQAFSSCGLRHQETLGDQQGSTAFATSPEICSAKLSQAIKRFLSHFTSIFNCLFKKLQQISINFLFKLRTEVRRFHSLNAVADATTALKDEISRA